MLKISKLRMGGGGKITTRILLIALLIALLVFSFIKGFRSTLKPAVTSTEVEVRASLFHNHDSLIYYAERAYMDEDPRGLFVTGAAAYLKWQGELPDSLGLTTVSRDEADIMLLRAADLGSEDAKNLIHCLHENGAWHHSIPEAK